MAKHEGGCHCGTVRYSVDLELDHLLACNCSICGKTGAILAFVSGDKFQLLSGEQALTDYQFNTRVIHHLFCSSCGIRSFSRGTSKDGSPTVAVNVRCLDGVDVHSLKIETLHDGRNA